MVTTLQDAQQAICRWMDQRLQNEPLDVSALAQLGVSARALADQAEMLHLLLIEREATSDARETALDLLAFFRETDERTYWILGIEQD